MTTDSQSPRPFAPPRCALLMSLGTAALFIRISTLITGEPLHHPTRVFLNHWEIGAILLSLGLWWLLTGPGLAAPNHRFNFSVPGLRLYIHLWIGACHAAAPGRRPENRSLSHRDRYCHVGRGVAIDTCHFTEVTA